MSMDTFIYGGINIPGTGGGGGGGGGNAGYQAITSAGQTIFTLTTFTYTPGDKGLSVYINGLRQTITTDYTETSSTIITFTSTITSGNVVEFVYAIGVGATGPAGPTGPSGGIIRSLNNISTNISGLSVANTDYVYYCTATLTFTLPTAVANNNRYTIKNVGGTTTIATTSSQTIDGSTTATLGVQYTALELVSDGTNWNII